MIRRSRSHSRPRARALAAAMPWRSLSQRFSFVLFTGAALFMLVLDHAQPNAVAGMRSRAVDMLAPVLDAVARPMTAIEQAGQNLRGLVALRADNARLRDENAHLTEWRNSVIALQKENHDLRDLLRFKAEPNLAYVSARVVADTGGAYTRGLIITAGRTDGVREGMAAMTGDGLIGRVVEVGDWSSRVLLITDLNARIPVSIAETSDRAIMAGDNSTHPKLLFMPHDATAVSGMHVVTSGHGGIFPADLPIGTLTVDSKGGTSVNPSADLGRVTYVRLVDFDLKGGAFNPMGKK